VLFAAVAPVSFLVLPFAALLTTARPRSRWEWVALGVSGGAALALLATPGEGSLDAVSRGWIVLVTVAFAAGAKFRPPVFWHLALRACLYAVVGMLLVVNVRAIGGAGMPAASVWTEVQWEATRHASRAMRYVVEVAPGLYPVFEPAVRLFAAWPLWLVLETVAGLALAWRGRALLTPAPLSPVAVLNT
jgi:hypothetical protein